MQQYVQFDNCNIRIIHIGYLIKKRTHDFENKDQSRHGTKHRS